MSSSQVSKPHNRDKLRDPPSTEGNPVRGTAGFGITVAGHEHANPIWRVAVCTCQCCAMCKCFGYQNGGYVTIGVVGAQSTDLWVGWICLLSTASRTLSSRSIFSSKNAACESPSVRSLLTDRLKSRVDIPSCQNKRCRGISPISVDRRKNVCLRVGA